MNATRIAALRAMANADESPHEQEIARLKLAEAGVPIDPPRPPAPPAASPSPWPDGFFSGGSNSSWNGRIVTNTGTTFTFLNVIFNGTGTVGQS